MITPEKQAAQKETRINEDWDYLVYDHLPYIGNKMMSSKMILGIIIDKMKLTFNKERLHE